ncbi:MAG: hypothetical protein WC718_00335 [Phycisphaerales bacterium]|jgi:hypothetical protein
MTTEIMDNTLNVTVGDGKYTVVQGGDGGLRALRYGEEWRDCCGDGLIYALAVEVIKLRAEKEQLVEEWAKGADKWQETHDSIPSAFVGLAIVVDSLVSEQV